MYKMLSVCLALSFGFITAETSTINQIEKKSATAEVKKPRINTGVIDVDLLESKPSETTTNKVVKKLMDLSVKNKKSNEPDKRSEHQKEEKGEALDNLTTPNVIETNMEIKVATQEEEIDNEKLILQGKEEEEAPRRPKYIQGPRRITLSTTSPQFVREHEDLFFSEYAEGSSNNKYLEIYNSTDAEIDLSGYGYPTVSNAQGTPGTHDNWNDFDDGATVAAGDVYVICHGSAASEIQSECDETHPYLSNGDDAYALVKGVESDYEIIDVIGQNFTESTYSDPGSAWAVAGVSGATKDHVLVRKSSVQEGNTDWAESAGTSAEDSEWIVLGYDSTGVDPIPGDGVDSYEADNWSGLGSHIMEDVEEGVYFSEDFEGTFPPAGWTNSATYPWEQGPSGSWYEPSTAYSGSYAAGFDDYNYSSGSVGDFITPDIDLTNAVAPKLSFYYYEV